MKLLGFVPIGIDHGTDELFTLANNQRISRIGFPSSIRLAYHFADAFAIKKRGCAIGSQINGYSAAHDESLGIVDIYVRSLMNRTRYERKGERR
jgi:hypothetical protein